jgi:hypothetical protein
MDVVGIGIDLHTPNRRVPSGENWALLIPRGPASTPGHVFLPSGTREDLLTE